MRFPCARIYEFEKYPCWRREEKGFNPELKVGYLSFCSSNEGYQVPDFARNFNMLFWTLIQKEYQVDFTKKDCTAIISKYCYIDKEFKHWQASYPKKEDYWIEIYCWERALKEAAYLLAKYL